MKVGATDDLAWNSGLSAEQSLAASEVHSHARLLAGPGTGKTHTLARRIVFLVQQENVDPTTILALTFTRMAARDLQGKISQQLAPYTDRMPYVSTLHSFALRQLRKNQTILDNLPRPIRIADDWEERQFILEDLKLLTGTTVRDVRAEFRRLSANWETLEEPSSVSAVDDARFVGAWSEHRRIYGYTLRAELVYQLWKALEQYPGFQFEAEFQHVLIDEYQDLNPCDLAIAGALAAKGAVLLACGDDDQSIYGFRHADPKGIREFVDEFSAIDMQLTQCYRCAPEILAPALWVARLDPERIDKELNAVRTEPEGEVILLPFPNGQEEAKGVARLCKKLINQGVPPKEILILVRSDHNGAFSKPLVEALTAQGIPASSGDNNQRFATPEERRLLSILRLVVNEEDDLAWRTILHMTDGIGTATISTIYSFARQEGIRFAKATERLSEFEDTIPRASIQALRRVIVSTHEAIAAASLTVGANDPSSNQVSDQIMKAATLVLLDEQERIRVVAQFEEFIGMSGALDVSDFLQALATNRENVEPHIDKDNVNIMTMHKAKGLTAQAVFVVAAEDEMLPHDEAKRASDDDRRLLYVSLTRAMHKLYITYCGSRDGAQQRTGRNSGDPVRHLSRFLRDASIKVKDGTMFSVS